jgi:hypothetical protein
VLSTGCQWRAIIPTKELPKLLAHDLLNEAACRYPSFSIGGSWSWLRNEWGAAMSEAAGHTNNLDNIALHFHNGEIWGVNADILRHGEHGEYQWLLIDEVEKLYRTTVPRFIDCATREYGVELPIKLVAGAVGVKGRRIAYQRRFLPYLGPEGVGGYRRKCAEVAERGYEGFVFASQGEGGTVHTIAAE